jgi:hemerythrin
MLYIVWSSDNELGIPIIDEQHRGIVSTINSFYYFIQQGHGSEALSPTLNILAQYTNLHFKAEETLLERAKYAALDAHSVLHKDLAKRMTLLARDLISKEDANSLLQLLKDWWLGHINLEDRKYTFQVKKELGSR